MQAARELAPSVGVMSACASLGVARASYYRSTKPKREAIRPPRPTPARALSAEERAEVLAVLHSERFVDHAPAQIHATLLDEDRYLCSIRTMYRVLEGAHETRERRRQRRHPVYAKPELVAEHPNEVWTWDITKLRGPVKGVYYQLYVILDIYSRYVVGWMLAERESEHLAERLIRETCVKEWIAPGQLTVHADRGAAMKSKTVALLCETLGITKSHSRPHVSDDNPYSESQFKTLKYRPTFPDRFGSFEEARTFLQEFFHWYNHEHHHSGIAWLTPATVHRGLGATVVAARKVTMASAYDRNPERFVHGIPQPSELPAAAWINQPKPASETLAVAQ